MAPFFCQDVVQLCCPENLTGWSQGLCPVSAAWLCHDQRQLRRITSAGCRRGRRRGCRGGEGKDSDSDSTKIILFYLPSQIRERSASPNTYQVFPSSMSQVGMFPVMMTSGSCSWRLALAVSLLLINSFVGIISLHAAFYKQGKMTFNWNQSNMDRKRKNQRKIPAFIRSHDEWRRLTSCK